MTKEKLVAFIDTKTKEEYESLKDGRFEDKALFNSLMNAIEELKNNPNVGIKIPRNLWPKEYLTRFQITNLWKYNLPNGWRLVYTIGADEIKIVSIILEWFNHKEYEKKFNY